MFKRKPRIVNGYILVYKPEHPSSMTHPDWLGWIYEHRYKIEILLGRPLEHDEIVHHIDGNRANNDFNNLKLMTRASHGLEHNPYKERKKCSVCGCELSIKAKSLCSSCRAKQSIKVSHIPSIEELSEDMKSMSWVSIGKKYGVSDNAMRKWAKKYGLL